MPTLVFVLRGFVALQVGPAIDLEAQTAQLAAHGGITDVACVSDGGLPFGGRWAVLFECFAFSLEQIVQNLLLRRQLHVKPLVFVHQRARTTSVDMCGASERVL